jgi:hypothetical protein
MKATKLKKKAAPSRKVVQKTKRNEGKEDSDTSSCSENDNSLCDDSDDDLIGNSNNSLSLSVVSNNTEKTRFGLDALHVDSNYQLKKTVLTAVQIQRVLMAIASKI